MKNSDHLDPESASENHVIGTEENDNDSDTTHQNVNLKERPNHTIKEKEEETSEFWNSPMDEYNPFYAVFDLIRYFDAFGKPVSLNFKGREKFNEELEETHQLFKGFVSDHRPSLDISKVATGEHWFGIKAKELGLVDDIQTSDDYLQQSNKSKKVISIKYVVKKGLAEKFSKAASMSVDRVFSNLWQKNRIFPG